jgi:hypothetical protein
MVCWLYADNRKVFSAGWSWILSSRALTNIAIGKRKNMSITVDYPTGRRQFGIGWHRAYRKICSRGHH